MSGVNFVGGSHRDTLTTATSLFIPGSQALLTGWETLLFKRAFSRGVRPMGLRQAPHFGFREQGGSTSMIPNHSNCFILISEAGMCPVRTFLSVC
jgi:hypothetical protein